MAVGPFRSSHELAQKLLILSISWKQKLSQTSLPVIFYIKITSLSVLQVIVFQQNLSPVRSFINSIFILLIWSLSEVYRKSFIRNVTNVFRQCLSTYPLVFHKPDLIPLININWMSGTSLFLKRKYLVENIELILGSH